MYDANVNLLTDVLIIIFKLHYEKFVVIKTFTN